MQCFEVVVNCVKSFWVSPDAQSLPVGAVTRLLATSEASGVLVPFEDGLRVSLAELASLYCEPTLIAIATV